jgi:hypothetical protein
MLKFFFKKEHQVKELIQQYLDALRMVQKSFCGALDTCLVEGICDKFDYLTGQTHKFESKADDVCEEIKTFPCPPPRRWWGLFWVWASSGVSVPCGAGPWPESSSGGS